ncbi:MAG: carbohydrate porin [Fluviibacter sp.]
MRSIKATLTLLLSAGVVVMASGGQTAWAQTAGSLPRLTSEEMLPTKSDLTTATTLFGDWGGLRPLLDSYGVNFTLNQTSDYLGNTSGGIKQGFVYDGLLDLELDIDLNKLMGWRGGKIHLTGYGIQGQDLSTQNIGNLMTVSNVESQPSLAKIGEFWLEQRLMDNRLRLRGGLLEADRYYMMSPTATVFVNSTFGFPDSWEANMPGGGPGFPNAAPGGLASFDFNDDWKLTASVMNGSPVGPSTSSTSYGISFPVGDGALSWVEAAYTPEFRLGDTTLPGNYKLGGWYNSAIVDNVTQSSSGRTFGSPINTSYRGQYAIYGLVDQTIWREAGTETQGLSAFTRVTYNPQTDRNLVTWYFDAGLAYVGLFGGRPQDILGLGFGWAKFTPYLNGPIAAQNNTNGTQTPLVKPESLIELTYQAPINPWLTLQPFLQYAVNPGGSAPMPNNPNQAIPNATIVGLRANVAF